MSPQVFAFDKIDDADARMEVYQEIKKGKSRFGMWEQSKSYIGSHIDKKAVDQIVAGIQKYGVDAGLLITTSKETEILEDYIRKWSEEIGKNIDLMARDEVARFVLRYGPDLLLGPTG